MNNRQENTAVNEGTADQEFTVGNSDGGQAVNENVVKVKTLERCFIERIDKEMGNIVDTVENRIQNAILTAIDSIITPEIESAIRSMNASSGRGATSVMVSSERGEHIGITALLENVSEMNNTPHVLNINDETRKKIPDEVSELSVPDTHFDRQSQTHHSCATFWCKFYSSHFIFRIILQRNKQVIRHSLDTTTIRYLFQF